MRRGLGDPGPRLTGVFDHWSWPARIALLVLAAATVALFGDRLEFNEWPWSTYPTHLYACGYDFSNGGAPETKAQAVARGGPIENIGSVP